MPGQGLKKNEKLKSRKAIEHLFRKGRKFSVFPILVWYDFHPSENAGVEIGVSCSSRTFRRAVDRNRIKRLLREAYRLQKSALADSTRESGLGLHIFFVYTDKQMPDFSVIKSSMHKALEGLQNKLVNGKVS